MVARFGIRKQTLAINHDSTFAAFFVKEKAVQITAIYNYQRGHRGSWFD